MPLSDDRRAHVDTVPPEAHPACTGPPGSFRGHAHGFGNGAPQVGEGMYLFVGLPRRFGSHYCIVRGGNVRYRKYIMRQEQRGFGWLVIVDVTDFDSLFYSSPRPSKVVKG